MGIHFPYLSSSRGLEVEYMPLNVVSGIVLCISGQLCLIDAVIPEGTPNLTEWIANNESLLNFLPLY